MPLYATTLSAQELKKAGPWVDPGQSRIRKVTVTHDQGDEAKVFVQVQCHGNLYKLYPNVAIEVPTISRRRFVQAFGENVALGVKEVMPGSPEYAKVRFGDYTPATPSRSVPIPTRAVLLALPKDALVEMAQYADAKFSEDGTKKEIADAIDAVRV